MKRLRASMTLVAAAAVATAAATHADDPALDIKPFMNWVLDPATDVVWGAAGWVVTEAGEESLAPTTDEGWIAVRNAGAVIAESGRALLQPGRARDARAWAAYAGQITALGLEVVGAAERRDSQAIFDVGGRLYVVCVACHQTYAPEMDGAP